MSSGVFINAKYAASYGAGDQVHPIRVQPETLAATVGSVANATASGALTSPISATVSRSKRSKGLIPRHVSLRFGSSPPSGYLANGVVRIPCLTTTFFNACIAGATGTYLGSACTVVSVSPEYVR